MNLPLTSLVPAVVELISFWQKNWPNINWYPNWYLGVPYRFLIGPIIPLLVLAVSRFLPVSLEMIYILLICLVWIWGGVGLKLFCKELGAGKVLQKYIALIFLFWPFSIFLLGTGSGLGHIAISFVPWVWWLWSLNLKSWKFNRALLIISFITLILLVNTGTLLPLCIGLLTLLIEERRLIRFEIYAIRLILIIFVSIALSTIWYSPMYWWVLINNPSFAGKPLYQVLVWLVQLIQALIPLVLGWWIVQKRKSTPDKLALFAVIFGSSFIFLMGVRFLSDIDFWIDWTGYFLELQIAIAILISILIHRYAKLPFVILFMSLILTIGNVILVQKLYFNSQATLYKQEIIQLIKSVGSAFGPGPSTKERFFLSGSPVFWLGSLQLHEPGLVQVRGNRDEAATHDTWAMGAYQIREGQDPALLKSWLAIFGVNFLLLHRRDSQEFFHDYKNTERFAQFEPVAKVSGNELYSFQTSLGRIVNVRILDAKKPRDGQDLPALKNYVEAYKENIYVDFQNPQEINIKLSRVLAADELISLSITHNQNWQLKNDQGQIFKDAFGNMLIKPGSQELTIQLIYKESWRGSLAVLVVGLSGFVLLYRSDKLDKWLHLKLPSLVVGKKDEETEY